MIILGIDPGEMTGLAEVRDGSVGWVEQLDWERAMDWVYEYTYAVRAKQDTLVIAVEKYTITAQTLRKTRQLAALYSIGAIMLTCRRLGAEMTMQRPGEAKSLVTNDALRHLGWYELTVGKDHGRDALRHAVYAAVRFNQISPDRLVHR